MHQDHRFRELHRADPFTESYMRWLVHHEFGADHRPFVWGRARAGGHEAGTLDYWLAQWVGAYGYLVREALRSPASVMLVSYEELCGEPERVWARLTSFADLGDAPVPKGLRLSETGITAPADPELLAEALAIRAQIDALAGVGRQ